MPFHSLNIQWNGIGMGPGTGAQIHQNAIRISSKSAAEPIRMGSDGIGMGISTGTGMIVRFPLMPVTRSGATSRDSHPEREFASF